MNEKIEELLSSDKIIECISYLRENTKCYTLIKILCERIENDNNYKKDPLFWNDYSISHFYLGNKEKAYQLYDNIFPYSQSFLVSESDVDFYFNNMSFSLPLIYQNDNFVHLDVLLNSVHKYDNYNKRNKIFDDIDEAYFPMNPSIIKTVDGYSMSIRTVNYMFDSNFRYITNGLCNSVNYIVQLDENLEFKNIKKLNYAQMPYNGNFDGWEDIRLFLYKNKLHCSFTSLQTNIHRRQTICLSNLSDELPFYVALDNYGGDKIQKNWVPIVSENGELFFIYSFFPLTILRYDENIKNVKIHQVSKVDKKNKWRGGSPAISLKELGYDKYYLCIVHESEFPKYKNKFVLMEEIDKNIFKIKNESDFFYFIDGIVEFCSGLTISHNKENFVISFGKRDNEFFLVQINVKNILRLLLTF